MLENIGTVATQSIQLWVNGKTLDLGWMHGQVSFSAFVHPFDTWADFSHLIDGRGSDEALGVHYFCSVLPERRFRSRYAVRSATARARRHDGSRKVRDVVRENGGTSSTNGSSSCGPMRCIDIQRHSSGRFSSTPRTGVGAERLEGSMSSRTSSRRSGTR